MNQKLKKENKSKPIFSKKYYTIALDPIHIGTGGMRLGRVDLPILREPGTNLPKIPGSTINGCARSATATAFTKRECAGSGGEGGIYHCGKVSPACEICVPFGFSKGSEGSLRGLAQFYDARILFFPVASMVGPVWITCPTEVNELIKSTSIPELNDGFIPIGSQLQSQDQLNFGWLLFERLSIDNYNINEIKSNIPSTIPELIKQKIVLVSEKLFATIINSNLEVRTSISIDPNSGTTEEGALFTFEAIPRTTIFQFDVIYNSGVNFKIGGRELKDKNNKIITSEWVRQKVERGMNNFETLGIGGMNTRGMGRIKVLNLDQGGGNSNL
jgi:CRISPR-associated protein Cmr4